MPPGKARRGLPAAPPSDPKRVLTAVRVGAQASLAAGGLWCQRMSNAFEPEWHGTRGGNRVARLAAAAGSQRLGASIVELASGALSSPYHFHHANEELLIVLSGTPELRMPDGLRELQPGEVVSFPCGPEGAHRLRNASSGPCRILVISEMNFPDIVSYPDTGTTLAVTAPGARLAFPGGSDGPLTDLIAAAFDADPGSVSSLLRAAPTRQSPPGSRP